MLKILHNKPENHINGLGSTENIDIEWRMNKNSPITHGWAFVILQFESWCILLATIENGPSNQETTVLIIKSQMSRVHIYNEKPDSSSITCWKIMKKECEGNA